MIGTTGASRSVYTVVGTILLCIVATLATATTVATGVLMGVVIVFLLTLAAERLHDQRRSALAIVWTVLPAIEAAVVYRLTRPLDVGVVVIAFAVWGVFGHLRLATAPGYTQIVGNDVAIQTRDPGDQCAPGGWPLPAGGEGQL